MAEALWLAVLFGVVALSVLLVWLNFQRGRHPYSTSPMTCRCGYKAENIWDLSEHIEGT